MQTITKRMLDMWRAITFGVILALLIGLLLFWHIGSHPPSLSTEEVQTVTSSKSLHDIFDSPINAPLTIPEHFFEKIRPGSVGASRAASAIYATLAIILFFMVLRYWQDFKTALLGTALFGTSSWLLHVGRLDAPGILLLGVVLALALGLWLKHTLRRNLALMIGGLVAGALLYIPGMIWFMLIGIVWLNRDLIHELKHIRNIAKIISTILFLGAIIPLVLALIRHPEMTWTIFGLPQHFSTISSIGRQFLHVPMWLFWRGPGNDPTRWLGTTPVFNVFEIVMLILGVYSFWHHRQLGRSKAVLGGLLVSWVLIALGGPITITMILPFLYIAISGGVHYMFETWFSVFPANPVARVLGVVVLVIACLLSCNYHLQNYFVAWQHNSATKAVFTHKPPRF